MPKNKWIATFFVITACLLSGSWQAFAGEATTGDYLTDIGTKFVRGLGNVVSSPAEIPCNMVNDVHKHQFWGVFSGFGKGIVFMGRRLLVGVDEVGTFMIPMESTLPPLCQMD